MMPTLKEPVTGGKKLIKEMEGVGWNKMRKARIVLPPEE